ncbi:glycosyltransferase family 8 protein [Cedecea colo]|uniref:Lipopolysaccharide 1,2-glucosyltransferase n=1 Tax=Cedecea colo TaxID=2552946 RepID=A0ABX0VT72_9ENTR|nr:glycosyltransferase [Cedecea colo]NIY49739.1 lipopolysaccharide 1,2-glucosyltransferase [Cedecea colo]
MKFEVIKAIDTVYSYGRLDKDNNDELHIAYGVDKNFQFGTGVSITSIIINNREINLTFHIFTDYYDKEFLHSLEFLALKEKVTIKVYMLDKLFFKELPSTQAWSIAMYYRFIAFEYLSSSLTTLLYLDADVMCKGSLLGLSHLELSEESYAAVVRDVPEVREIAGKRLGIPCLDKHYFNSGVMYTSLKKWREDNIFEKALELLLSDERKLQFYDQDALNILFVNHTTFLSENYNCIYGIKRELKFRNQQSYKGIIKESTVLIHYIGVTKPWNSWADYPSAQFFKVAYLYSPWAGAALIGPRTPKQYKKKSRHERLQGKYFASVKSYIGYLVAKLKKK